MMEVKRTGAVIITLLFALVMATSSAHALPGVQISDIDFSNTEPVEGEGIVIYATLFHNNSTTVSNLTVVFSVDGEVIGDISGISLDAYETQVFEYEWTAEGGTHNVAVMIEINGQPIPTQTHTEEITVVIGDVTSLLSVLVLVVLVILGTALFPAILSRVQK